MYLTPALKPYCKLMGICLYLVIKLLDSNSSSHPSARYGVLILNLRLGKTTRLGSMIIAAAAGAPVPGDVQVGVA
jgi:hypothetical protein